MKKFRWQLSALFCFTFLCAYPSGLVASDDWNKFLEGLTPVHPSSLFSLSEKELQDLLDTLRSPSEITPPSQNMFEKSTSLASSSPATIESVEDSPRSREMPIRARRHRAGSAKQSSPQIVPSSSPSVWTDEETYLLTSASVKEANAWFKDHPEYSKDKIAKIRAERRRQHNNIYFARYWARKQGWPLPPLPEKKAFS